MTVSGILLQWFFPARCVLCNGLLLVSGALCPECEQKVEYVGAFACDTCGIQLAGGDVSGGSPPMSSGNVPDGSPPLFGSPASKGNGRRCPRCRESSFAFTQNTSVLLYDEYAQHIIYSFKYYGKIGLGVQLGKMMADRVRDQLGSGIDYIMPVPIHRSRLKSRGYNQAEVLAAEVSKELRIPMLNRLIKRHKHTEKQFSLNPAQRRMNVADAFRFTNSKHLLKQVEGKSILIVDDIFTTGSTLDECSGLLLKQGECARINSVTLAIVNRNSFKKSSN